jgi:16S rRNA (cytosine1402-N4)-methyltransferase
MKNNKKLLHSNQISLDNSVFLNESIDFLNIKSDGIYVDCTLGSGGHSEKILSLLNHNGVLIALDCDSFSIEVAKKRLSKLENKNYKLINENFTQIQEVLHKEKIFKVDGILYDLGFSILQINDSERGFSYHEDSFLDMRMDQRTKLTAYDIINGYSQKELERVFYNFGEEKYTKIIVSKILKYRSQKPITTTLELVNVIKLALPKQKLWHSNHHPSKKIFQALRIEVNQELKNLISSLQLSLKLLKERGRLVVISFHSLEDRIVKNIFNSVIKNPIQELKIPSEQQ